MTRRGEPLLAGGGWAPITPPLGVALAGYVVPEGRVDPANSVLEDLLACVLVLRDAEDVAALVVLDLIEVTPHLRELVEGVGEELGVPRDSMVVAATHTHSGPEMGPPAPGHEALRAAPWDPVVLPRTVDGVRRALRAALGDLAPARARAGRADCAIGCNRRERGPDGRLLGLPWLGRAPWGPVDREVTTLRLARHGRPDIILASFGCHPAVLGTSSAISPDLFGPARRRAAELLDGALVLLAQGASGDVNPIVHPGTPDDCRRLGERLGTAIAHAVLEDAETGSDAFALRRATCPVPARTVFPEADDPMAQGWIDLQREWLAGRTVLEAPIAALRIGSAAVVGVPVELFATLGRSLRGRSPLPSTAVVTHCAETLGYAPDRAAYDVGGYEPSTSPLAPGAGEALVDAGVELLSRLAT